MRELFYLGFIVAACCGCPSAQASAGYTGPLALMCGFCCLCLSCYSDKIMVFAAAIAHAEGYGIPGAIPTRNNNPGDLVESGDLGQDASGYAIFSSPDMGWQALYHQVNLYVMGTSRSGINLNSTITQLSQKYTTTQQAAWAQNVADYLGGSPSDSLRMWLT